MSDVTPASGRCPLCGMPGPGVILDGKFLPTTQASRHVVGCANIQPAPVPDPVLAPIPMRLVCEGCGELHVDEGEYATKAHHTHTCQHCGLTWRPAVVPTVGVRFLPGFQNETAAPRSDGASLRTMRRLLSPFDGRIPGLALSAVVRELVASEAIAAPTGHAPTAAHASHGAPRREDERNAELERECHFAIWNVTKNAWAGGVMVRLPRSLAGHQLASIQAAEPESTYEVRDVRTGKKVDSP